MIQHVYYTKAEVHFCFWAPVTGMVTGIFLGSSAIGGLASMGTWYSMQGLFPMAVEWICPQHAPLPTDILDIVSISTGIVIGTVITGAIFAAAFIPLYRYIFEGPTVKYQTVNYTAAEIQAVIEQDIDDNLPGYRGADQQVARTALVQRRLQDARNHQGEEDADKWQKLVPLPRTKPPYERYQDKLGLAELYYIEQSRDI